ncbi:MAG: hypothetical protein MUC48_20540 [Leptolyngbya sp. Prado105]|jgi:hypothetical protein|nr:hypothetical protein [Leptolyngbya sp. Prado105]
MTQTPHDHFAKAYLEELLSPIGQVAPNIPIKAETRYADIWFVPESVEDSERAYLGLLGKLTTTPCLIEPFRNPADEDQILDCVGKLISLRRELLRKANREKRAIPPEFMPRLWILVPSASVELRREFAATRRKRTWGTGIYHHPNAYRTGLIVLHQLPQTSDTLWLRILSRGRSQKKAIQEFNALSDEHPMKEIVLELLTDWRTMIELRQKLTEDEEELIVNLSPIYQQRRQEWREEGRQEGRQAERRSMIESLLLSRFNALDAELAAIVDQIATLSPSEFTPLLLSTSREDLLRQFSTIDSVTQARIES